MVRIQEVSGSNPLISTIEKDGKYRKIPTVFFIYNRTVERIRGTYLSAVDHSYHIWNVNFRDFALDIGRVADL